MGKKLQLSYKRPTTSERYQKLKDYEKKKKTINNDGPAAVSYTSRKDEKTIQEEIQEFIFFQKT